MPGSNMIVKNLATRLATLIMMMILKNLATMRAAMMMMMMMMMMIVKNLAISRATRGPQAR